MEKQLHPAICAEMQKAFDALDLPPREGYPAGWAKLTMMVSPDGTEVHAIGGDRKPGDGDTPFIGLERMEGAGMLTPNALGQEPCAAVCARSPAPEGYTSGTTE